MKRPTYKKTDNYDRQYLIACLAMSGYGHSGNELKRILTSQTPNTLVKKLNSGDFTRADIIRLKDACNMDVYDVMRCFFTSMLSENDGKKYAIREMLISILTDEYFDD